MTEQRSTADFDGIDDPLVSSAYRESAAERTPDALNQAVMRQAGEQLRTRFFRPVVWLRPMAWAATIGLSLAIVIELSTVPQPAFEIPVIEIPASVEMKPFGPRARKTITDDGRVTLQNAGSLQKAEAAVPATSSMISMPCAGDIRDLPEPWLECIKRLKSDGLVELADSQREQLQQAFPDFKLP